MKKLIVLILAMFIFVVPAFAEDECPPDLQPYITAMQNLQTELDETGDTESFTAELQNIINNLQNIRDLCSPFQEVEFEHLAVSYPRGWVQEILNDDTVIFGTSPNIINALNSASPAVPSGEVGVGVFINVSEIFGDLPPNTEEPLRAFANMLLSGMPDSDFTFAEPVYFSVNDRRALRFDFAGEAMEASVIIVHLGDENYTIMVPITAVGEFANFESTLMEILESTRYIP